MQINIILTALELIDRGLCLTVEIGMDIAGDTGNIDNMQARAQPQAVDQIDGGDDRSANLKAIRQYRQPGQSALAPDPDRVAGLSPRRTLAWLTGWDGRKTVLRRIIALKRSAPLPLGR
jgi:hypothetical protein